MSKQSFACSMETEIIIGLVAGDLQVKGWDQPEIIIDADPEELHINQQENKVLIDCQGDCKVRVPESATIQVDKAEGDALFKFLEGPLTIGVMYGSLEVRQALSLEVKTVHGNLVARSLSGDVKAGQVYGQAELRDVDGGCWLEKVSGNLDIRDVQGEIHAQTLGNARLRLSSMPGAAYEVQAEGNIHCHIPEEVSLKLELHSGAGLIRLKLPDGGQNLRQQQAEITLGEGLATMKLRASATISLLSQQADWTDIDGDSSGRHTYLPDNFGVTIAKEVEAQIQNQLENMDQIINQRMAHFSTQMSHAGLSQEETERAMERARHASERAAARTEEKMRRAQEKLERKLEQAQRRKETNSRGRRSWSFEWPSPPTPPTPPAPPPAPVSEEERLMILRMLEQKKISLEEADRLLAALEGKQ